MLSNKKGGIFMKKSNAFTLAEVLITLGIIGVVAAMTMPTLINQTNGAQFRAGFKKELSVISQAAALNQALEDWDFRDLDGSTNKLSTLLDSRVNVVNKLTSSDKLPDGYDPQWKSADFDLDDIPVSETGSNINYYLFNDGSMFVFDDDLAKNCTDVEVGSTGKHICHGYFDVNGFKGPNRVTTCDETSATETDCYVKSPSDIFPVIFYDQTVLPGSKAGQAVLADRTTKKASGE